MPCNGKFLTAFITNIYVAIISSTNLMHTTHSFHVIKQNHWHVTFSTIIFRDRQGLFVCSEINLFLSKCIICRKNCILTTRVRSHCHLIWGINFAIIFHFSRKCNMVILPSFLHQICINLIYGLTNTLVHAWK